MLFYKLLFINIIFAIACNVKNKNNPILEAADIDCKIKTDKNKYQTITCKDGSSVVLNDKNNQKGCTGTLDIIGNLTVFCQNNNQHFYIPVASNGGGCTTEVLVDNHIKLTCGKNTATIIQGKEGKNGEGCIEESTNNYTNIKKCQDNKSYEENITSKPFIQFAYPNLNKLTKTPSIMTNSIIADNDNTFWSLNFINSNKDNVFYKLFNIDFIKKYANNNDYTYHIVHHFPNAHVESYDENIYKNITLVNENIANINFSTFNINKQSVDKSKLVSIPYYNDTVDGILFSLNLYSSLGKFSIYAQDDYPLSPLIKNYSTWLSENNNVYVALSNVSNNLKILDNNENNIAEINFKNSIAYNYKYKTRIIKFDNKLNLVKSFDPITFEFAINDKIPRDINIQAIEGKIENNYVLLTKIYGFVSDNVKKNKLIINTNNQTREIIINLPPQNEENNNSSYHLHLIIWMQNNIIKNIVALYEDNLKDAYDNFVKIGFNKIYLNNDNSVFIQGSSIAKFLFLGVAKDDIINFNPDYYVTTNINNNQILASTLKISPEAKFINTNLITLYSLDGIYDYNQTHNLVVLPDNSYLTVLTSYAANLRNMYDHKQLTLVNNTSNNVETKLSNTCLKNDFCLSVQKYSANGDFLYHKNMITSNAELVANSTILSQDNLVIVSGTTKGNIIKYSDVDELNDKLAPTTYDKSFIFSLKP